MILNVTLVVVLAQGINVRTHLQLLLQAGHQVRRRRHRGWQSHRKPNLLIRHKRKVRSLVVFKLVVRVDLSLGQGSERLWDNATSLLFAGVGRRLRSQCRNTFLLLVGQIVLEIPFARSKVLVLLAPFIFH
jgi:hypothetical protein